MESKPLRGRSRAAQPPGSIPDRESQRKDEKGGRAAVGSAASRSFSTGRSIAPPHADRKEKKTSSLWNWKPLKALSHILHRRFDCVFSLTVHSIENIPPALNDVNLCIHWRRATSDSTSFHTRLAVAHHSTAKFEETLTCKCSVYGSRSRAQGTAKYEAKHFLIYASMAGAPGLDLGKHRIDLTRLLPLNLEDLDEGKSSGKWSTSFRLSGKAIGASLIVTFGFSVVVGDEKAHKQNRNMKTLDVLGNNVNKLTRLGSLPGINSHFVDDVQALREIMETNHDVVSDAIAFPKVGASMIDVLNTSAEMKCCVLPELSAKTIKQNEDPEFLLMEHGIELAKEEDINVLATKKMAFERSLMQDCSAFEVIVGKKNQKKDADSCGDQETVEISPLLGDSSVNDLNSIFFGISDTELEEMGYPEPEAEASEKLGLADLGLKHKEESMKLQPHSLDDLTEEIASEFLSMLEVDHCYYGLRSEGNPESPREQLWEEFKRESLVQCDGLIDFDIDAEEKNWVDSLDFSSKNQMEITQELNSKSMARIVEDAETQALLHEWGLEEKYFVSSPPVSRSGFGSPIDLPPEELPELPSLGENLGPFVQTKDGGFLRSMSPNLFKDSKSNGKLIMQVSKPIVMPAEMGTDNIEILQHLSSIGVEKLSMQANKLMPLEEITGCFMQQLAWEATPDKEAIHRQGLLLQQNEEDGSVFNLNNLGRKGKHACAATYKGGELDCDYVSLDDLAPLAIEKMEALSIEGLKIQSGMSDQETSSNITKQFVGEMPGYDGKDSQSLNSLGLEGAVGLHLPNIKDNGNDMDGLMDLSITLDEWIQLDMGIVEEDELSDRTLKILAAHHAKSTEFSNRGWKDGKRGWNPCRRWGLLENNFTVALMVQLRDPLRNYERVGTPMLALIQVERVFIPPKPKIYCTVFGKSKKKQEDESDTEIDSDLRLEKESVSEAFHQFKVTKLHVAGLKSECEKTRNWGSSVQQQSGSRWLLANGMGKHNKHPFLRSNTSTKISQLPAKNHPEALWSISSGTKNCNESALKWKESSSKPQRRNSSFLFFR